jgi:hypothetical protein
VEAGEKLGFLPGDLTQKVDPYLRPLYDALYELMGFDRVVKAFERSALEIAPLAFMRGRTLNNAFVILDEAQNTTPEQMKMFLTRIGLGSKAVVTGDVSQIDLPKGSLSGLVDAERIPPRVKGIAHTRFTSADVVRHPLVARIVDAVRRGAQEGSMSAGLDLSLQFGTLAARPPTRRCDGRARAQVGGDGAGCAGGDRHRIVGSAEGQALNRQYRGKDYATQRAHLRLWAGAAGGGRPGAVRPGRGARGPGNMARRWGRIRAPAGAWGCCMRRGIDTRRQPGGAGRWRALEVDGDGGAGDSRTRMSDRYRTTVIGIVTGPSFTRCTCMSGRELAGLHGRGARRAWRDEVARRAAAFVRRRRIGETRPVAAAHVSAASVNWLTTSSPPADVLPRCGSSCRLVAEDAQASAAWPAACRP